MKNIIRAMAVIAPFALAAAPAVAQSGSTQTPPSPNASSSAPTPATSAPPGAMTANPGSASNPHVSGAVGGGATTAPAAGGPSSAMQRTVPTPSK